MHWMKAPEAAAYASVSVKVLYGAVRSGRLKAARIGAGRNVRFCDLWVDEWLAQSAGSSGTAIHHGQSTSAEAR